MLDKKKLAESSRLYSLVKAGKNNDFDTVIELCDKFLSEENIGSTQDIKELFKKIKNAAESKEKQKVIDALFKLADYLDEGPSTMSAKEFVSQCTLALKTGNRRKAEALSAEYAKITEAAMLASGKPKLSDNFLLDLTQASINRNMKQMKKLLKKIS